MVRILRLLSRPSTGKGERIITYSDQTQSSKRKMQQGQLREISRNFNQNLLQIQFGKPQQGEWFRNHGSRCRVYHQRCKGCLLHCPWPQLGKGSQGCCRSQAAMPTSLKMTSIALGFKVMDPSTGQRTKLFTRDGKCFIFPPLDWQLRNGLHGRIARHSLARRTMRNLMKLKKKASTF